MTISDYAPVLGGYRSRGLLLDTNLLLLFLVGSTSPNLVPGFKILANQGFQIEDFKTLLKLAKSFQRLVTTPHILTEVSNHADKLKGRHRTILFEKIAIAADNFLEESRPSKELCQLDGFPKFGLADTAIAAIALNQYLVLTIDLALVGHLQAKRAAVINFHSLRGIKFQDV
jgi:hypothetical protein